jgi:hypothetical protein
LRAHLESSFEYLRKEMESEVLNPPPIWHNPSELTSALVSLPPPNPLFVMWFLRSRSSYKYSFSLRLLVTLPFWLTI